MLSFVRQAMKDMQHTGAVWPSGPALTAVMTRSLKAASGPRRLLEVGPGTGAFTKSVLKALRPGDEFVIVELNQEFSREIDQKLLRPFRNSHPGIQVELVCAPIQTAPVGGQFDYIVCGLPFNNFPPSLVRAIMRRLLSLLRPGGELAYFEYAGVRAVKSPLVNSRSRQALKRIGNYSKALRTRLGGRTEFVLGNIPPCMAVRLPAPTPDSAVASSRPRRLSKAQQKAQAKAQQKATKTAGKKAARKTGPASGSAAGSGSGLGLGSGLGSGKTGPARSARGSRGR